MKALVTGGAGFIGQWTARRMSSAWDVTALDSLSEQVHQDPDRGIALCTDRLDPTDPLFAYRRGAMGGVDPDDVDPSIEEGMHPLHRVPGRTQGGNDLGATNGGIGEHRGGGLQ